MIGQAPPQEPGLVGQSFVVIQVRKIAAEPQLAGPDPREDIAQVRFARLEADEALALEAHRRRDADPSRHPAGQLARTHRRAKRIHLGLGDLSSHSVAATA